jgi:hypothetical protein
VTLSRQERQMLDAWLVGADFPMAPVVRRLLAQLTVLEDALRDAFQRTGTCFACGAELEDGADSHSGDCPIRDPA